MKDKNKNIILGVGGFVLLLLVTLLLIAGCVEKARIKKMHEQKIDLNAAPRPVEVEAARSESGATRRRFPGIVKASEEAALAFRVGGPLVQVNVRQGAPVKKGDLLMQIDPRDYEDRIESLDAQLTGARALQKQARREYGRISNLFAEKVVPQSDFDRAESARDGADASVESLQAALRAARHALEDTSLKAPYDGTVSAQYVENYEIVRAGQVVMDFHTISGFEVTVSVSENEIVKRTLSEELTAQVSFPALAGKTCEARLKEWSSSASPLTRTYAVTFEFFAPAGVRILPGMSADVTWYTPPPRQSSVVSIPASALSSRADGSTFVWVCREDGQPAESRTVTVDGLLGASRAIVTEGLSEGELVVVSGSRLIHENQALAIAGAR